METPFQKFGILNSELMNAPLDSESRKKNAGLKTNFVAAALIFLTWMVYGQVRQFDFTNYDDMGYLLKNSIVLDGLTVQGLGWAFTTFHMANWHPLTWISHMADVHYFGLNAGGHHIVSVILHLLNTLLLFYLLLSTTGSTWKSGWVAALFAVHPLHVQSVAWIAERKDVLSTFFGLLTFLAYQNYLSSKSKRTYGFVLLFFFFSLMSKPMLVTLPVLFLLFDFWPLQRFKSVAKPAHFKPVLVEKIPLLVVTLLLALMTLYAQQHSGAISSLERFSLSIRLQNSLIAYFVYLKKLVWPTDLSVIYLLTPANLSGAKAALCGFSLIGISGVAFARRSEWPFLFVGWFWYVLTLIPVIGLIQVGPQAYADRYTYVPLIGIFILIAWGTEKAILKLHAKGLGIVAGISTILIFSAMGWKETQYWRNSMTLFHRAVILDPRNSLAHNQLGVALYAAGNYAEAIEPLEASIRDFPDYRDHEPFQTHQFLGLAYADQNKHKEALRYFDLALEADPKNEFSLLNKGMVYLHQQNAEQALSQFFLALSYHPQSSRSHQFIGAAFDALGKIEEAQLHFEKAIELDPSNADAHNDLGTLLAQQGKLKNAREHFLQALKSNPQHPAYQDNLDRLEAVLKQNPNLADPKPKRPG